LTSGSRGSVYGAEGLWGWSSGSLNMARHPGPAARQMVTAWNSVSKLHGWWRLGPDIHSRKGVTGGPGTQGTPANADPNPPKPHQRLHHRLHHPGRDVGADLPAPGRDRTRDLVTHARLAPHGEVARPHERQPEVDQGGPYVVHGTREQRLGTVRLVPGAASSPL